MSLVRVWMDVIARFLLRNLGLSEIIFSDLD